MERIFLPITPHIKRNGGLILGALGNLWRHRNRVNALHWHLSTCTCVVVCTGLAAKVITLTWSGWRRQDLLSWSHRGTTLTYLLMHTYLLLLTVAEIWDLIFITYKQCYQPWWSTVMHSKLLQAKVGFAPRLRDLDGDESKQLLDDLQVGIGSDIR